ncbi:hypothetical protein CH373_16205 [Leptospira perolatii]|uniref:Uncharacterized protein n=1 Tax=Leptospira perolatii TaxID=2023191 RepID=A0A2M9ZJ95_9LEPT|nr:hypothetical protein [Leptospira perolatii]PJZ68438.1 hypothetical protein CH360_16405 [Leptospira perolatii]PJZ72137.1 hypothetical protein CH373_16205 [Leptospira perolatii]
MNLEFLRNLSHKFIVAGLLALYYWSIVFIVITGFGLKVFKQRLTELFLISVLGISVIIIGCFLLNILTNLTIIADSIKVGESVKDKDVLKQNIQKQRYTYYGSVFLLPSLLVSFLFLGDYLTLNKKEIYWSETLLN